MDFESEDNKCNLTGSTSLLQVDISGSSDSSYSLWGGSASVVTLSTSPASSDKRCQLCGQKYHLSWDQPWQQNLCSRCREGPETIKDRILKVVDSIHDSQYRPNVCSPENFKGSPLKPDAHNTCTCRDEVVAYCHDCNKLLCPWCFEMHQDNSSYEKVNLIQCLNCLESTAYTVLMTQNP